MTDKRRDALLAKQVADKFLGSLLDRKRGGHRYPWWPHAAASYSGMHIQPYLPRFCGYEVRTAKTEEKSGGKPFVVAVTVALATGKKDKVIGELTVMKENGEWGVVPTKWKVLGIERSE